MKPSIAQQITELQSRIDKARRSHANVSELMYRLRMLRLKELKQEIRQDNRRSA